MDFTHPSRRRLLAASAAIGAGLVLAQTGFAEAVSGGSDAIRPFRFEASEEALTDLKRRIAATRWPSRELVADPSWPSTRGKNATVFGRFRSSTVRNMTEREGAASEL